MKTILEKIPQYKQVRTGYKQKVSYQTDDGEIFGSAAQAELHEKQLAYQQTLRQIVKAEIDFDFLPEQQTWYYIATPDDLMFIYDHLTSDRYCDFYLNGESVNHKKLPDDLHVGDWVTCIYKDGGDHRSKNDLYTLEFVKSEINKLLEGLHAK